RRISPTSAPSACTSSRSGTRLGGKWMSLRFTSLSPRGSLPGVGALGEAGALGAHYAEALPGRGLHHYPGRHRRDALRTELLEAAHLGLDVVGFDVEVHAALVCHL